MKNSRKVRAPINLNAEEEGLFIPFLSYKKPSLKIKVVREAFITNSGLVCNRIGLMRECYHYTYPNEFQDRLNEVSYYYNETLNNENNLIIFDDENTYLVIHHTWHNNYYHWICDILPRLWMVRDSMSELVLLLPSESQLSSFVKLSLAPFNFKKIVYIPPGKSVQVRTLCLPQLKPVLAAYIPETLKWLNCIYVDYVSNIVKMRANYGERIYVSREKSRRRKIINEAEVVSVLTEYEFKKICHEDYNFFEQVSIYSQAKYLIGAHGAGLANMLFMPQGSKALEFHKRLTNPTDHHSAIFWYMADALGHQYYQQVCNPSNSEEDFYQADYIVDIPLFRANMKLFMGY